MPYFAKYATPTFQKTTKRLAPEHLSEVELHNNRCYFRAFELKPDAVGTEHFGIGSGVAKLRLFVSEHYLYPPKRRFSRPKAWYVNFSQYLHTENPKMPGTQTPIRN